MADYEGRWYLWQESGVVLRNLELFGSQIVPIKSEMSRQINRVLFCIENVNVKTNKLPKVNY